MVKKDTKKNKRARKQSLKKHRSKKFFSSQVALFLLIALIAMTLFNLYIYSQTLGNKYGGASAPSLQPADKGVVSLIIKPKPASPGSGSSKGANHG